MNAFCSCWVPTGHFCSKLGGLGQHPRGKFFFVDPRILGEIAIFPNGGFFGNLSDPVIPTLRGLSEDILPSHADWDTKGRFVSSLSVSSDGQGPWERREITGSTNNGHDPAHRNHHHCGLCIPRQKGGYSGTREPTTHSCSNSLTHPTSNSSTITLHKSPRARTSPCPASKTWTWHTVNSKHNTDTRSLRTHLIRP